jgi:type IV secretory pathway VirB10-like protein
MNMKDDYLWDKTGEPDPEVQQLEEILGTLRYQPRPLEIPAGLHLNRERNFFRGAAPRLAIAATIAMLLLGLGVWIVKQRSERSQPSEVVKTVDAPAVKPTSTEAPTPNQESNPNIVTAGAPAGVPAEKPTAAPSRHRVKQSQLAENRVRRNADREALKESRQLAELREAEAAKDQLMIALRVVSAKLTYAQKKTQGTNQIHNQHKIG